MVGFIRKYQTLFQSGCCVMHACSVMSNSLQFHGWQPTRVLCPWNIPVKNSLPFPPPGDLSKEPMFPESPALLGGFFTTTVTWEAYIPPIERGYLLLQNIASIWCFSVLYFSHSIRCTVISCFNSPFPNDLWCWATFHMLNCHLYIFFGEVSVQVFYLVSKWILFCFVFEF